MGPAVMPSGGEDMRDLYSEKRRLDATEDAMTEGQDSENLWGMKGGGQSYCWSFWSR